MDKVSLERRHKILKIIEKSRRGHVGSAFSLVEILYVLYQNVLKFNPKNSNWSERDRFILSKGHGCLALYVEMAERGYFPEEELWRFCAEDGILGGHPEYGVIPGVEASTGSLGHGLPIGVGFALAAKIDKKQYRTFVLISDGECNEGSVWEAALCASKHKLDNLFVILDYNRMQCYASTSEVLELEPLKDKWQAFGFEVREADGHSISEIQQSLSCLPYRSGAPSMLICNTLKGKGIPIMENNPMWHHKARLKDDELEALWQSLRGAK